MAMNQKLKLRVRVIYALPLKMSMSEVSHIFVKVTSLETKVLIIGRMITWVPSFVR